MENATDDTIEGAMNLPNEYAIDVNDMEDNSNDEGNNPNGGENNPNDNEDPHKHAYQRKPRKKTSKIWNEFNEVVRDGVKKAQCNYCKGDFSIPSSASCKKQKTLSIDIFGTECVANVGNFKYDRNKYKFCYVELIGYVYFMDLRRHQVLTCIYVASKAEENHVSTEELGKGIEQDHQMILTNEMIVLQE
ncbi:hypothetical protein U1Q18_003664 [Sarracenia purpurea var. burkii]